MIRRYAETTRRMGTHVCELCGVKPPDRRKGWLEPAAADGEDTAAALLHLDGSTITRKVVSERQRKVLRTQGKSPVKGRERC